MESGEIRKNTRLNIYSDEEAQVRHKRKGRGNRIFYPYLQFRRERCHVSHGNCHCNPKASTLSVTLVALEILIALECTFATARPVSGHLRLTTSISKVAVTLSQAGNFTWNCVDC